MQNKIQIATWNVNSIKVRFEQLITWLQQTSCDIVALQELKLDSMNNEKLVQKFADIGYQYVHNAQKTYNGVAILSKYPITNVVYDIPNYNDEQKRVIVATINGIRIICAYFVNGESIDSPKYKYKLEWMNKLKNYVTTELSQHNKLILLGDYNIAPESRDTYAPIMWEGQVLCSDSERQMYQDLLKIGLVDSYRHSNQRDKCFTWWDYRNMAFRRNQGLRIDHILVSSSLQNNINDCVIDVEPRKLERPSDHAPVILTLDFSF